MLPSFKAWKTCLGCSYEQLLRDNCSIHTKAHHHMEAVVVSLGQLKKLVVNTSVEL